MTATEGQLPQRVAAELRYLSLIRDQRIRMHDWEAAREAMDLYNKVFCRWYDDSKRTDIETPN